MRMVTLEEHYSTPQHPGQGAVPFTPEFAEVDEHDRRAICSANADRLLGIGDRSDAVTR